MKIVLVSNFAPDTNYTRDLAVYFKKKYPVEEIFLCGPKNEDNSDSPLLVDRVWRKNSWFIFDILRYIKKVNPQVVHLQHEIKMYGGIITVLLFPWLVLFLKIKGYRAIVTIHAVVSVKQLNKDFFAAFGQKFSFFKKVLIGYFFYYIYKLISWFSYRTIVHLQCLRDYLFNDYHFNRQKLLVWAHGVRVISSEINIEKDILGHLSFLKNKKMVLVFGYFSPRKGYETLIEGFIKWRQDFNSAADWVLVFAGDAQKEYQKYKDKIVELIKKEGADNYIFIVGPVNSRELDYLYRQSEIVALPAAFGVAASGPLAVALAYQKPLLGSDVDTIKEEITALVAGEIYQHDNIDSCSMALNKMTADKGLLQKFKENIINNAAERSWQNIAERHYRLYLECVK